MKSSQIMDLYSDYLISVSGPATAVKMSQMLDGRVSHDQVQRMLAGSIHTSADLWLMVKKHVRQIQSPDAVLIIDDSIAHKPYTDENDIVCWHYDHGDQRNVKGINFLTCMYYSNGVSLPVGFELVSKTQVYTDATDGLEKRRADRSKNELYRQLLRQAADNGMPCKYVVNDIWFASAENMEFVKNTLKKDFIMRIKGNRTVAVSASDKKQGRFQRVDELQLETLKPVKVYLKGLDMELLLVKQVFTNEDGSTGVAYLVSSDTNLDGGQTATIYKKRWNVEPYHKSLKQNAALEKSPTQTVTTQSNHFFAALCAYVKLELLKTRTTMNHFALKSKLLVEAAKAAYLALQKLHPHSLAA